MVPGTKPHARRPGRWRTGRRGYRTSWALVIEPIASRHSSNEWMNLKMGKNAVEGKKNEKDDEDNMCRKEFDKLDEMAGSPWL